jgi:phage shock protein PspC (stress-responsive transcriptional regulator)
MAAGRREEKDRDMTETPQQDRVNTEHLRDYSQLRRSVADQKVAGVAGGLGRHLNIDPTILRVAFVVLALFGGAGLLLYVALWLFVPEDGQDEAIVATSPSTRTALLIVTAVVAALLLVGDSWGGLGFPWPLAVIALVAFLVLMNRDKPMSTTYPPPQPGSEPGAGTQPDAQPGPVAAGPEDAAPYTAPYYGNLPPTPSAYPVQQPPAPRPPRGPKLFWFTVALLAVALGSLGLYDVTQGGVADAAYPALALAVIGGMLVVGAWFGRPGGLIALGVVAAIALLATSVAEPRFAGERMTSETPTTAIQVEDRYFVPAGAVRLDLSNIRDVERLDGRSVEVEANAGELVVILPENLDVEIEADVAVAGEITVLGETRGGTGVSMERSVDGGPDAPRMDLKLDVVFGSIEVRQ